MKLALQRLLGLQRLSYDDAKMRFDAEQGRYFLVRVTFDASRLADNLWLQKRMVEVVTPRLSQHMVRILGLKPLLSIS